MAGEIVLVVDDSASNLKAAQRSLRSGGFDVRTATSGQEAIAAVRDHRPALVLLDLYMPDTDGLELTRRLKADPAVQDTVVLAVISPASASDRGRAIEAGCDGYLVKPIDRKTLPAMVASHITARKISSAPPAPTPSALEISTGASRALTSRGGAPGAVEDVLAETFQQVATAQENLRALVNSMDEVLVTLNREQRVTGVYGRWMDSVSLRPSDIQGKRIDEILGAGTVHEEVNARALAGESVVYEWMIATERGPLYLQTAVSPLRDASGDVQGVLRVGRDVTKMKWLQEELLLSDRLSSVGLIAAGVAHEINNPLTIAVGNLQLAKEAIEAIHARHDAGGSDVQVAALRSEITDASDALDRVGRIVRDLRVFCGSDKDERTNVDLPTVLESTLRVAINEFRHRARLRTDYGEVPPVHASKARLGQVFLNLIVHAAQSMEEGRAERNEIRVTTRTLSGGRAAVEVSSTGPAIPPQLVTQLFSPVLTAEAPGMKKSLGLIISHRIVTELGGVIEVDSKPGQGSLFRVILPASSLAPAVKPAAHPPPPVASRRGRVLIIDDDEMIGVTLTRLLDPAHDVTALSDARKAVARIARGERFDVILCDLMMPDMTGAEFYQALGPVAADQLDKIIFMSGGAFTPATHAFLDQTANTWLQKPFDTRALVALVNTRLG